MSDAESRSVGELLLENDLLARQILADVTGEQAPAMLRAWGEVVESAAEFWAAMPEPHPWAPSETMQRLELVAQGIHRNNLSSGWPGDGPFDERLLVIAEGFTKAAGLVRRHGQDVRTTTQRARDDIDSARMRTMHTLYVGSHGVAAALNDHVRDLYQDESRTRKGEPWGAKRRMDTISRLASFEQIASAYIGGRYAQALRGESVPPPDQHRIGQALANWDIQTHRAVAASATPANLLLVARTQSIIATSSAVILNAAARTGHIDPAAFKDRLSGRIDVNQEAWTQLAGRWLEMTSPAAGTDAVLVRSANELRAAIREITHDKTTWAVPEEIANRIDLTLAAGYVHQALAAAVDIACLNRDIAEDASDLSGPARTMAVRIKADLERLGAPLDENFVWVNPADVHANRIVPLPEPARESLVRSTDGLVRTTTELMSAAAFLEHRAPGASASESGMARDAVRDLDRANAMEPRPAIAGPAR